MPDGIPALPINRQIRQVALSPRQTIFCQRLVAGASGAEAARLVGYSAVAAAQQASRLLRNPKMLAELNRLQTSPELQH